MENQKACPTQAGTMAGYVPEYKNLDGVWKRIPMTETMGHGVARGRFLSEILSLANLFGYEAAMCIAWWFKANVEKFAEIRVVPYQIEYQMAAYRNEAEAEFLRDDFDKKMRESSDKTKTK